VPVESRAPQPVTSTTGLALSRAGLARRVVDALEGTADCPLLPNIEGDVMPPLTNVRFSATTK
jgi:hypothetical protein